MYIYLTKNLVNGKIYIGQSIKESNKSKRYLGSGKLFLQSIEKYGRENFEKYILIDNVSSRDLLDYYEIYYIALYNARDRNIGYNISRGGSGSNLEQQTKESNDKRSKSLLGRTRTDKEKQSISNGQRNMDPEVAKLRSEKISKKLKGKKKSKEAIEKNKNAHKLSGKEHPHTLTIVIFNENDELVYKSDGNFKKFCKKHNLPYTAFVRSYRNNCKRLYDNLKMCRVKEENKKFIGWYAVSTERKEK